MSRDLDSRLMVFAEGDEEEAKLLKAAYRKAVALDSPGLGDTLDSYGLSAFRYSFLSSRHMGRGGSFRDAHRIALEEVKVSIRDVALRGPPDHVREEHSAFSTLMYQGFQARFLDRHPGETPEKFLDRPRKATLNLTRLVVDILSQLYRRPPVRELEEGTDPKIVKACEDLWSEAYNLDLLETDRYTRLLGTVGVRPFYDPESPGRIKLWPLLSHQLRVVIDPRRPWKPAAVIERHAPFQDRGTVVIWTAKTFLAFVPGRSFRGERHGLGRIPVVFFRDRKSSPGAFFVEGRGRGLCDQNAVVNSKLTDLSEVFQYQAFAVPQVVNPEEDGEEELTIGPRRVVTFRPQKGEPHGLSFPSPPNNIGPLRSEIESDIGSLLKVQRIPPAALGADVSQRALSGVAIRQAMAPILEDNQERARLFTPLELELADTCLRIRAEHDEEFAYDPATQAPRFSVKFGQPEFPQEVTDRLKQAEFDVAHGILVPPELMLERWPDRYENRKDAERAWRENVDLLSSVSLPQDGEPQETRAEEDLLKEPQGGNGSEPEIGLREALRLEPGLLGGLSHLLEES